MTFQDHARNLLCSEKTTRVCRAIVGAGWVLLLCSLASALERFIQVSR